MIPNNLKQHRKARGLTQVDVAKRLGFTASERISKWEHGQMYPHILNLFRLATIYNKNPVDLNPELWFNAQTEMTPKPLYSPPSSPEASYPMPLQSQTAHESDVIPSSVAF